MTRSFDAIVQNGAIRPVDAVDLPENQRLHVTIETISNDDARNGQSPESARRQLVEFLKKSPLRLNGPLPKRDELYDDRV